MRSFEPLAFYDFFFFGLTVAPEENNDVPKENLSITFVVF